MVSGLVSGGAVRAQDFLVHGDAALAFTHQEMGPEPGASTDFPGHVEREKAGCHAGVWAQLAEVDLASIETERDIGATCFVGDKTGIDLRHCNGTECPGRYPRLSLTRDRTLLGG